MEMVIRLDMIQQFITDGTFQMNKSAAGDAFEMEMMTAIPLSHVLINVGRLGIIAVSSYRSLLTKLG
jgi:hypothetical protein